MSFLAEERPRGHGPVLEGLWRAAESGRLPHALLLRGPEGVGKFLAARWLAAGLLCEEGPGWPCGRCGACKRVASGNHADVHVVDATELGLNVIQIHLIAPRDPQPSDVNIQPIEVFLSRRALERGWRVVILRETERMNVAAQNAFLKTLEEPGDDVLLLLECSRPSALLDTVKSRVVPVAFEALPWADARAVLEREGMGPEEAETLARWSRGAPGRARSLAAQAAPELRRLVLDVATGAEVPARAAAAVWELEGEFPGKTPFAQRLARAAALLDVGLELWLDLERLAAGADPQDLAHGDVVGGVGPGSPPDRERRLEAWLLARQDVALNATPEALVDRALAAAAPRA